MNNETCGSKIKWIGIFLFVVGVLVTICSGAKYAGENSYPDTLCAFFIGLFITIVGLVIWHKKQRDEIRASVANVSEDNSENPITLLKHAIEVMDEFSNKINDFNAGQISQNAEDILDNYILPFADNRSKITNMFGMSIGAEILVTVAYGERMLNRVVSAGLDGHAPEARKSLPESIDAFKQASQLIEVNMVNIK